MKDRKVSLGLGLGMIVICLPIAHFLKMDFLDSVCVTRTCVLAEAREECRCVEAEVTGVCGACAGNQTQVSSSVASTLDC